MRCGLKVQLAVVSACTCKAFGYYFMYEKSHARSCGRLVLTTAQPQAQPQNNSLSPIVGIVFTSAETSSSGHKSATGVFFFFSFFLLGSLAKS